MQPTQALPFTKYFAKNIALTEAPSFVEATPAGVATSHFQHSFLYALLLTAQIFPKITALATKKKKSFSEI